MLNRRQFLRALASTTALVGGGLSFAPADGAQLDGYIQSGWFPLDADTHFVATERYTICGGDVEAFASDPVAILNAMTRSLSVAKPEELFELASARLCAVRSA